MFNMTHFVDDEVATSLKTCLQGLSSLYDEHSTLLKANEPNRNNVEESRASVSIEKFSQIGDSLDKLTEGLDSTKLLLVVSQVIESADTQYMKSQDNQRRLKQENAWLLDELSDTQKKLQESERAVGRLEEEVEHFKFLDSIKRSKTEDRSSHADINSQSIVVDTLQDLGFGPEEDDEEMSNNNNTQSTSSHNATTVSHSSYEVPSRLRTLHNLVVQYVKQGRYEVAVPLCKQALEDLEKANGHYHPDVATMLNVLAIVYRDQQKYKEAGVYLTDALSIREKCHGENHPSVAATLNNLAIVLGKRGKFSDAEPLCRRALKIRETTLGKDHPDVAKQLNNLGLFCQNLGKYEEVELYYKRSLEIYEANFGLDDQNTIKTKNNLSSIYLKLGKYKEAEELYKQILTRAHEKEFGSINNQNKPVWQVAEELEEKKRKGENVEGWESTIQNRIEHIEKNVVATLKNLGAVYRKQGKYEAAETLEDFVLRSKKQDGGPGEHTDSVSTLSRDDSRNRMSISSSHNGFKAKFLNALGFNT
uniref:Kinesin light chain n=2 Tax=Caenorhabditis tropicalis TaxID=1561998 RepID=A0A1I7T1E7_9PELO